MLVKMETLGITSDLFCIAEYDEALDLRGKRLLYINNIEFGECNFNRLSDWMRLINKIDNYDYTPLRRIILGDNNSSDNGVYKIKVINKIYNIYEITFKKPVTAVFGEIGEYYVTEKVTTIKGKLCHEWYYSGGADKVDGCMNGLEYFLTEIEIIK